MDRWMYKWTDGWIDELRKNFHFLDELARYKSGSINSSSTSRSKAIKYVSIHYILIYCLLRSTEYGSYRGNRLSTDSTTEGFESISSQPTSMI